MGRWLLSITKSLENNRRLIGKFDRQAQLATHGLNITTQRRKHQIIPFFHPSNCCLTNFENIRQLRLGKLLSFTQHLQCQVLCLQTVSFRKNMLATRFRELIQFFVYRTTHNFLPVVEVCTKIHIFGKSFENPVLFGKACTTTKNRRNLAMGIISDCLDDFGCVVAFLMNDASTFISVATSFINLLSSATFQNNEFSVIADLTRNTLALDC